MKIIGTIGRMWADNMYSVCADSIADMRVFSQMALCKPGEMIDYNSASASYHELGRNQLVAEMNGDWLLQVDTDHVFGPDLLVRLMDVSERYSAPVVSAIYQFKHPPHSPVAGLWTGDKTLTPVLDWDRSQETLQVGAVGAGALLVRRSVFQKIKKELSEAPFQITEGLSEDYSFCRRCRELGIPVTLALNIEAHHVTRNVLHVGDYKAQGELQEVKSRAGTLVLP